jgi:hypothetical protein
MSTSEVTRRARGNRWLWPLVVVDREGNAVEILDHQLHDDRRQNSPVTMYRKLDEILQRKEFFPHAE